MPEFKNPPLDRVFFEQALFLYIRYSKFLDDDYACNGQNAYSYFLNLINRTAPLFFVIVENDLVSGIVYLDNLIGGRNKLHSAEITTCFDRRFWGNYTKLCAQIFLNYCFKTYGFIKIKALVYPENFRVKTLLKNAGFKKEALLKNETLRNGKMQDIEIYSIFNKER